MLLVPLLFKPPDRLTAIALAISVITVVTGNDNTTGQDGAFRRQLPEVLDLLCPYDKTCEGGEPRLQLNNGMESCCTDCSCKDSCGLTESCCYPEQADLNYFDRSHQQCELPSTSRQRRRTKKHFFMVTSGYEDGSRENCGTANGTCGENEAASSLGSLYPVSSKTTSLIYKNEQCARCHGVARSDMIHWEVAMTCLLEGDRLDTMLQSLENGRVHSSCLLDFYYPGPQSEANVHLCYEHTMRSCLNYEGRPYYLPSYVDMTDDDVREACLTGPQALYGHHYNLFCHLCRYGRYNAADQCKGKDLGGRDSSAGSIFVLLGSSISKNKDRGDRTDIEREAFIQPEPIVCKSKDGLQNNADDCRPAICPSGKVRLGATCAYPDKTLSIRTFQVAVELYPGYNGNISPLIGHLKSHLQQGNEWREFFSAPGLNSWRLSSMCYPTDTQKTKNNGSSGFFWLKLTLERIRSSSLTKILAKVDKYMTGDWEFVINTTTVPLEQKFSEFEDVEQYNTTKKTYKQVYFDNLDPELSCTSFDPNVERNPGIQVTKTFFCDQVALQPEEYDLETKRSKRLYVNATGRVFSRAEYSLGYDAQGDPVPRLCLEDTDYVLVPQQNPASPGGAPAQNNWSILALVVIAHLI